MPDLLVKLYELPPLEAVLAAQQAQGITHRRAIAPEKHHVLAWVTRHFSAGWASECDVAFAQHPVGCHIAIENESLIGFACCDATGKAFFGPTGVDEAQRGRGVGHALLLTALHDLWNRGYAYGIIGAAGPVDFYEKIVGAIPIPDSSPGIYRGILRR